MNASQEYAIKLIVQSSTTPSKIDTPTPHAAKLCFAEYYSDEDDIEECLQVVENSDVSLIFAGRNYQYETEGVDLENIFLPDNQVSMIKTVSKASKKSILILNCGGPIDISKYAADVDAILFINYLGQEGGAALADIITGAQSPSGRLASTWPMRIEDVATFDHFPAVETGSKIEMTLVEGVEVGYRRNWPTPPRYMFGHGLSYTEFIYAELKLSTTEVNQTSELFVSIKVSNVGKRPAFEVIQVYVEDVSSSQWRPKKELKGFTKIWLESGTSEVVRIPLDLKSALSFWNQETCRWTAEAGDFVISVGSEKCMCRLVEDFEWRGL